MKTASPVAASPVKRDTNSNVVPDTPAVPDTPDYRKVSLPADTGSVVFEFGVCFNSAVCGTIQLGIYIFLSHFRVVSPT